MTGRRLSKGTHVCYAQGEMFNDTGLKDLVGKQGTVLEDSEAGQLSVFVDFVLNDLIRKQTWVEKQSLSVV